MTLDTGHVGRCAGGVQWAGNVSVELLSAGSGVTRLGKSQLVMSQLVKRSLGSLGVSSL